MVILNNNGVGTFFFIHTHAFSSFIICSHVIVLVSECIGFPGKSLRCISFFQSTHENFLKYGAFAVSLHGNTLNFLQKHSHTDTPLPEILTTIFSLFHFSIYTVLNFHPRHIFFTLSVDLKKKLNYYGKPAQ